MPRYPPPPSTMIGRQERTRAIILHIQRQPERNYSPGSSPIIFEHIHWYLQYSGATMTRDLGPLHQNGAGLPCCTPVLLNQMLEVHHDVRLSHN